MVPNWVMVLPVISELPEKEKNDGDSQARLEACVIVGYGAAWSLGKQCRRSHSRRAKQPAQARRRTEGIPTNSISSYPILRTSTTMFKNGVTIYCDSLNDAMNLDRPLFRGSDSSGFLLAPPHLGLLLQL